MDLRVELLSVLARRTYTLTGLRRIGDHLCRTQYYSTKDGNKDGPRKATTPTGRLDENWETGREQMKPQERPVKSEEEVYKPFKDDTNPETGEIGGPRGPEPTRYGDWERKGRVIDF